VNGVANPADINYPTIPRGTEWLRITPTPYHDDNPVDELAAALVDVSHRLALPRKPKIWSAAPVEGRHPGRAP
jgi:5-aminolevulinate synthase